MNGISAVDIDRKSARSIHTPATPTKKYWLFFGSEEAGRRNAAVFTLIQNCRLHGIDPHAYIKDALEKLPTTTNQRVAELTPLTWKQARAGKASRQAG